MRLLPILLFCALAAAQEELVTELLKLDAPPRDFEKDPVAKAFGKLDPPPDDAPLPDLLDFWTNATLRGWREPTAYVRERLLAACRADPERLRLLAPLLPATKEVKDFVAGWRANARSPREFGEVEPEEEEEWDPREDVFAFQRLAEDDWKRAQPIARELIDGDDRDLEVAALVALLEHGDKRARGRLKAVVEEANDPAARRNAAFRALSDSQWEGFDHWYLTLFDDDELVLIRPVEREPGKWIPVIARLLDDRRERVRSHAIACLFQFHGAAARADALRPLLPWLSDPDWAAEPEDGRLRLVQSLDEVDLPECVPGLLKLLAEEEDARILAHAFKAIAHYGSKGAAPLLRRHLDGFDKEVYPFMVNLCHAIAKCGGLERDEQVGAIVAYGRARAAGRAGRYRWQGTGWLNAQERLGWELALAQPADESVAAALLERSGRLPVVAEIVHQWPGVVSDLDVVRRIGRGAAPAASVVAALKRREQVRDNAHTELRRLTRGTPSGIAAALLGEPGRVLKGDDRAARRALLACARLVRIELPVDVVARLLPDYAARAYLEAMDTSAARRHLKGIVGMHAWPGTDRQVAVMMGDARETFALQSFLEGEGRGNLIAILIHEERAELRWSDAPGRYRLRPLDLAEAKRFAAFVKRHRIDELAPVPYLADDGISYYYLHLTPERGWRVYLNNPDLIEDTDLYRALLGRFERLTAEGAFETRYDVQDQIDGVEILATRNVFDVWADGDDIRVYRDGWQTLGGKEVEQPKGQTDLTMASGARGSWERELGDGRTLHWKAERGLWIERGDERVELYSGQCGWPLLTPDRRWLVLAIASQDSWAPPNGLLRVDLERGKTFKVDLPPLETNCPLVWLPAHGKMLIQRGDSGRPDGAVLLDPATGKSEKVTGTIWPFTWGRLGGVLQPTGRPFEYWAARNDENGTSVVRFDTKRFEITLERRFPGIFFRTRQMHVDGNRLYVAYEGDLLRLPLR